MSGSGIRRWLWAFGASLGINLLLCVALVRLQATPPHEKVTYVEITVTRPDSLPSRAPRTSPRAFPAQAPSASTASASPSQRVSAQPAGAAAPVSEVPGMPTPHNVSTSVSLSSPIMTSNTSGISAPGSSDGRSATAPPSAYGEVGLGSVGNGHGGGSAPAGVSGGTAYGGYGSLPAPSHPAMTPGSTGIRLAPRPSSSGFGSLPTPDPTPPAPSPTPPPAPRGPNRPARAVSTPEPPYPPGARDDGIEGVVQLQISLDARGKITGVSVVQGSGDRRLDQAAEQFVKARWRFEAKLVDGQAVASTVRARVAFTLH